jgi:hypothetical protein
MLSGSPVGDEPSIEGEAHGLTWHRQDTNGMVYEMFDAIVGRVIRADPAFPIPDDFRLIDDEGEDDNAASEALGRIVGQLAVDLESCPDL